MVRIFSFILMISIFICCGRVDPDVDQTAPITPSKKNFEMYQLSEMSMLMEQMFVDNERLKARIIADDTIGMFPSHFLDIHNAKMTDETENDQFFKQQAQLFLKAQRLVYDDPQNAKQHFNDAVDACIKCHEKKCGGPIPRIKKLYIQN